jgi:hypothetical protein
VIVRCAAFQLDSGKVSDLVCGPASVPARRRAKPEDRRRRPRN